MESNSGATSDVSKLASGPPTEEDTEVVTVSSIFGGAAVQPSSGKSVKSKPKSKVVVTKSSPPGGPLKDSSSSVFVKKVKKPKIILQHGHGHVLLDPFYGGFPTPRGTEGLEETEENLGGGSSSSSSSSSSSASSSTSRLLEFDEHFNETGGIYGGDKCFLAVQPGKLKGGLSSSATSLKRWRKEGRFFGGGGVMEEQRKRIHSVGDSATALVNASRLLPTVILTGDDDDDGEEDEEVDVEGEDDDEDDNVLVDDQSLLVDAGRRQNRHRQESQENEADNEEEDDTLNIPKKKQSSFGVKKRRRNQISPENGSRSHSHLPSLSLSSSPGEDAEGEDQDSSKEALEQQRRQSLKHLSVSAPAMRTASQKSSGGDGSDTGLPPQTTSKSRQKKFHRHFKNVDQDEKVLDYYSCALVGDILLQGFLYITENYFAFYSNVFGYVTKVLIPVCTVVRITKERTAKIFPNAVGVCTRTEKHVFASLISRDTTFKLMCKVWNYSIEQEAEEIRQLQRRVAAQVEAEDGYSADVPVPDETSGDSGSGNDSAMEPSSHSPSPQNTPGIEKLVHAKSAVSSHLVAAAGAGGAVPVAVAGAQAQGGDDKAVTIAKLAAAAAAAEDPSIVPNILSYRGAGHHQYRTSIPNAAGTNAHYNTAQRQNATSPPIHESSSVRHFIKKLGLNVGGRGPSLLLVATALLVILFVSAALLLSRISNLQQRLLERPLIHDSEQFYQELLSWQTKLHSTTGEEIHQYINSNLQQIVKVRESLEALSMLFVNRPHQGPSLGEPSSIMASGDPHHHHHKDS